MQKLLVALVACGALCGSVALLVWLASQSARIVAAILGALP
jgi:hypothetical protein